ncbi:MAG TPA: TetR/AcrR family transcriptional regulator C-terminal domain-containing protein [Galbitalea sp.]|nr:TetR/AcrR family transcriptional regulator C-terminal domain-containing protein [Galbitalea sp.]
MDAAPDDDLPRGIALAWGVAANPQRGPRRELNIEGIVETAVGIADADGLGAVSMSSVATALGFTTMSLYRYVSAKDDLILLMQEHGIGPPPLSIGEATDWRDGLTRWYRACLEIYSTHPWLLDIQIEGEPSTPNNLSWLDAGLAVLDSTPLDAASRVAAVLMFSGQSRWEAQVGRFALSTTEPVIPPGALAKLITAEQFPFLAPAIAAGAFANTANPFEFGLMRILDGLERHMAELSAGRPGTQSQPDPDREFARDERVRKVREQVRDAETKLRDLRKKEREAIAKAREKAHG